MQRRLLSRSKKVVREPDHQFLKYLCETFNTDIDDPKITEMDPIRKQWWYESWLYSIETDLDKWRHIGILIGSFTNPEAATKMLKKERPDYESTDKAFEESISMVDNAPLIVDKPKRRRRKVIRNE